MHLIVNGKEMDLPYSSAFDARDHLGGPNDVVILNGFQISTDHPLKDGDFLSVIPKGVMPKEEELESMMAARHTPDVHHRVKKAKVAIAGLGGLGSNIALMLARTGVGQLLLVDFDVVEPSNLNRQQYSIRHLGMNKTDALYQQIRQINPFIHVTTRNIRVDENNVCELFDGYDIVCEAFDNADAKSMLVNTVLEKLPQTTVVAASGMAGYGSSNLIQTKKVMNRFYLCGDLQSEARIGCGLMAPRVEICAGHQANMILRLLLDIQEV